MSLDLDSELDFENTTKEPENLEQYGVWVKKAPRDFENTDNFLNDMTTLSPDELSNITDTISENTEESLSEDSFDLGQMEDGEIDLSEFMDDSPSEPAAENVEKSSADIQDGDVDLSEFMDTESVDLDSFMDSSDFAEKAPETEIQDEKPIDMELSFDDNYQEEDFPAAEETDSIPSDFDANAILSETSESEDFDSMFDNIVDEAAPQDKPASDVAGFTSESVSFEDVTDFDDLLSSLDDTPQQSDNPQEEKKPEKENNDIDISVSMDSDEDNSQSEIEVEKDSDEPVEDVPLFGTIDASDFSLDKTEEIKTENNEAAQAEEIEDFESMIDNAEEIPEESSISIDDDIIPEMDKEEDNISVLQDNDTTLNLDELNAISETADIIPDAGNFEESPSFEDTENIAESDIREESNVVDQEKTMNEMSNSLLEKIYGEITSLKDELSSLKLELNTLKASGIAAVSQAVTAEEKTEEAKEESSGFFSDLGDDETIALSGDELNNILINSDFKEENPEGLEITDSQEPVIENSINDFEAESAQESDLGSTAEINDSVDQYEADSFAEENNEIDFDSNLVEPSLDDLDFSLDNQDENEEDTNTDDTLSIDDIVVESTSDNIIDTDTDAISDEDIASFDDGIDEELPLEAEDNIMTSDELPDADMLNGIADEVDNFEGLDQSLDEIEGLKDENPVTEETIEPVQNISESKNLVDDIDQSMKQEVKSVLAYMDQLLENLPEDKIAEFAKSEHFETYKKLFQELGIS